MDSMCSSVRLDISLNKILRILPRLNETTNSIWITNKARFIYDAYNVQRLLHPQINISHLVNNFSDSMNFLNISWDYAYDIILNK